MVSIKDNTGIEIKSCNQHINSGVKNFPLGYSVMEINSKKYEIISKSAAF